MAEMGDEVGLQGGEIAIFVGVGVELVKFDLPIGNLGWVGDDEFPSVLKAPAVAEVAGGVVDVHSVMEVNVPKESGSSSDGLGIEEVHAGQGLWWGDSNGIEDGWG